MSTRSLIGYLDIDTNTVKYTYCHFDGYPEGVGKTLIENYNSLVAAQRLTLLKGFSSLEDTYAKTKEHEYDEDTRGEMSLEEYKTTSNWGVNYKYLFYYDEWSFMPIFFMNLEGYTGG